jgi:hypothetical protein
MAGLCMYYPSHRRSRYVATRNGDEERGTPIFKMLWNDEYTALARPKLTWIAIHDNLGRRSRNDEKERGTERGTRTHVLWIAV